MRMGERGAAAWSSAAVGSAGAAARLQKSANYPLKTFLSRYFYFCMTLLMSGLAVWAFSRTVDARLLHAQPPRPRLLWFHAAVFLAWFVVLVAQSTLVRVRKMRVHRTLGWVGAGLAALMVVSGFVVSIVILRYEITMLHQNIGAFLGILWCDLIVFGGCMGAAIYFRKKPEYHRRLVFLAACQLMQAVFVRLPYLGRHDLYFPAVDALIAFGMVRDGIVDGQVNRVYVYVLPGMIALQGFSMYLQRVDPSWWHAATQAMLGG